MPMDNPVDWVDVPQRDSDNNSAGDPAQDTACPSPGGASANARREETQESASSAGDPDNTPPSELANCDAVSLVPSSHYPSSMMSSFVACSLRGSMAGSLPMDASNGAQLATAVFIGDIEDVLERVWEPKEDECDAGSVVNLSLSEVLHKCTSILVSMRAVICCETSSVRSRHAAADVLAWIALERATSRLLRSKEVASDVIRLALDSAEEISVAGHRVVRNLVAGSFEYCKAIVKSHAFKTLGIQTSNPYTCEILSNITSKLNHSGDPTSQDLLTRVFNVSIASILEAMSDCDHPRCMACAFSSLTFLMRPKLAERILSDSRHLQNICSGISQGQDPYVQEAALRLIDSILHLSYRVDEVYEHLMDAGGVTSLFALLQLGQTQQEFMVLKILKSLQSSQQARFEAGIRIEELTRIQLILDHGEREHQKIGLVVLSGLLQTGHVFEGGVADLGLARTVVSLLEHEDYGTRLSVLSLLDLMASQSPNDVIQEVVTKEGLENLQATLESAAFAHLPALYSFFTTVLSTGGSAAAALLETGAIFPLLLRNVCQGDPASKFGAVLPCLKGLKLELMDDWTILASIEEGMVQFVLAFCCTVVDDRRAREGGGEVMEDVAVVLRILERILHFEEGVSGILAECPQFPSCDDILISMLRMDDEAVVLLVLDCILLLATSLSDWEVPERDPLVLDALCVAMNRGSINIQIRVLKILLHLVASFSSLSLSSSGILMAVSEVFQRCSDNQEVACLVLDIIGSMGLMDIKLTAKTILRNPAAEDCAWNQYMMLQENLTPQTRRSVLQVFNEVRKFKAKAPAKVDYEGAECSPCDVEGERQAQH
ncbi:hypothetical protein BSKO_01507 [Bryopsis sp. KO-2023]|nr:hypothetical protein BSKO_01507 [Bryopsis sp. KO-2023]